MIFKWKHLYFDMWEVTNVVNNKSTNISVEGHKDDLWSELNYRLV